MKRKLMVGVVAAMIMLLGCSFEAQAFDGYRGIGITTVAGTYNDSTSWAAVTGGVLSTPVVVSGVGALDTLVVNYSFSNVWTPYNQTIIPDVRTFWVRPGDDVPDVSGPGVPAWLDELTGEDINLTYDGGVYWYDGNVWISTALPGYTFTYEGIYTLMVFMAVHPPVAVNWNYTFWNFTFDYTTDPSTPYYDTGDGSDFNFVVLLGGATGVLMMVLGPIGGVFLMKREFFSGLVVMILAPIIGFSLVYAFMLSGSDNLFPG